MLKLGDTVYDILYRGKTLSSENRLAEVKIIAIYRYFSSFEKGCIHINYKDEFGKELNYFVDSLNDPAPADTNCSLSNLPGEYDPEPFQIEVFIEGVDYPLMLGEDVFLTKEEAFAYLGPIEEYEFDMEKLEQES